MQKHLVKTLIAAAAAMASFAAHAVDVYGNIDAGYSSTKSVAGQRTHSLASGNKEASVIGFRGAENLGGGLKLDFNLEAGFDSTDGSLSNTNVLFNRNANIGVSGGFGAIKLGQISSLSRDLVKKYDAFGFGEWGVGKSFNTFGEFQADSISYSNSIGPVKAGISRTLAGVPGGGLSEGAVTTLAAGYDHGPVSVGVAYTTDKSDPATTAKVTQIGGSYALGIGKAYALYEDGKDVANGEAKSAYLLGFKAPVTSATSVLISAGHKEEVSGQKHGLFAIGATHNLSKRTALYSSFSQDDVKDIGKAQTFSAGLTHQF